MIPRAQYPFMVSVPVSPFCELAKWTLDRLGIEYYEACHAPVIHVLFNKLRGGGNEIPVLTLPTGPLTNGRAIVEYFDARSPAALRLFPSGPQAQEVRALFNDFCAELGVAVRAWAYAYMLYCPALTIPMWSNRAGFFERIFIRWAYPLLAFLLGRALGINDETIATERARILRSFDRVEALLADGRKYLTGDTFTAADLAFVVMAAPAVLPPEYDCPMPAMGDLPFALRAEVEGFRQRPAGEFLLRVYHERPRRTRVIVSERKHGFWQDLQNFAANTVLAPRVLRPVFSFLRSAIPILRVGKSCLLSKASDISAVLDTPDVFTVGPNNGRNFAAVKNEFVLGMDPGAQYTRERDLLREVVFPNDLETVRVMSRGIVAALLAAPRSAGKMDLVREFSLPLAARICAHYFGVPGPNEQTLLRWMRTIFHTVLGNPANNPQVLEAGKIASAETQEYLQALIKQKRLDPSADDVLCRMIRLQAQHPWLDDHAISRNIAGLMVGTVETLSKFMVLCVEELLRNDAALNAVRGAASDDPESLWSSILETVRFNPPIPFLRRDVSRDWDAPGNGKAFHRGTTVYLALCSAMFDETSVVQAQRIQKRPGSVYLHFGAGIHSCFGRELARQIITEAVRALMLGSELSRVGPVIYDGPFPDEFVLRIGE